MQGAAEKGVPQAMDEKVAELYSAAGGEVELALCQDMLHGLAAWSAPDTTRLIERAKPFIAPRLLTAAAAGLSDRERPLVACGEPVSMSISHVLRQCLPGSAGL